ncbi:MAG TPA: hypothetical protein DDX72_06875 [Ruminococcaceae bacterium]|nr:hypothetical protein [Oscillospiraceae bacterium]
MSEWFDRIFNSEELDTFAGTLLIGGIGAFFYIMNWLIFINNMIPGRKWSSMIPPLGGLIIAVLILILGGGWWALIGLTDPCIFLIVYSLIKELGKDRTETDEIKDKEETEENGRNGE